MTVNVNFIAPNNPFTTGRPGRVVPSFSRIATAPCEEWDLSGIAGPTAFPTQFPALWEIVPGAALARPLIDTGLVQYTHQNGGIRRISGTGDCGGVSPTGPIDPETASFEISMRFVNAVFASGGGTQATGILALGVWCIGSSAGLLREYTFTVNLLGDAGGTQLGPTYALRRKASGGAQVSVASTGAGPLIVAGDRWRFQVQVRADGLQSTIRGLVNNTEVLSFVDNSIAVNPQPDAGPISLQRISTGSTGSASVIANFTNLEVFSLNSY